MTPIHKIPYTGVITIYSPVTRSFVQMTRVFVEETNNVHSFITK